MLCVVAIATVAATACGSSAGKPATSRAQNEASRTSFASERYGFRVTVAKDWSHADASVDWDGRHLQGLDSPAFVKLEAPAAAHTLVAAAAPVASDMPLAEWRAAMVRAAPPVCSESPTAKKTTLGGEPALTWTASCSDGYHVNKLAAVHGKRGYMILMASPTSKDVAENRRVFASSLRSFRFTS